MAGFRFGLRAVLELREREERARRLVVAGLERERLQLEGILGGYQESIRSTKRGLRVAMGEAGGRVDAGSLRLDAGSAMSLQIRAHQVALRLAGVHRRLETARRALAEAMRARRAMEVVRDRRLAAWESEEKRRESAMLDEIGTIGASRRGGDREGGV